MSVADNLWVERGAEAALIALMTMRDHEGRFIALSDEQELAALALATEVITQSKDRPHV